MLGTKEICALLLAGGMGAGSVVAVQEAKPAIAKLKKRPAPIRAKQAAPAPIPMIDNNCPPVVGLSNGPVADLSPLQSLENMAGSPQASSGGEMPNPNSRFINPSNAIYPDSPFPGGGGNGGGALPVIPSNPQLPPVPDSKPGAVPQPATWIMLVAGFGFVGMALRRTRLKGTYTRPD